MKHQAVHFDHTAVAVRDATAEMAMLRVELGAIPLAGEEMQDFRFVVCHVGDEARGMKIELVEPFGDRVGFMHRFLDRHGEGAHHLCFLVEDLESTIAAATAAGVNVIKQDLRYPPWREAFISPDSGCNVVIQLADSTHDRTLIDRGIVGAPAHPTQIPHATGGRNRRWWAAARDLPAGPRAFMTRTVLGVHDLDLADKVFGALLGGKSVPTGQGSIDYQWNGSVLRVLRRSDAGLVRVDLAGSPRSDLLLGSLPLVFGTTPEPYPSQTI